MGMANGAYAPNVEPSMTPDGSDGMQNAVIKVNFALSWKQIAALALGAPTFFASVGLSGWLFLPAKDKDVKQLELRVTKIGTDVDGLKKVGLDLTTSMDALTRSVQALADRRVPVPNKRP